MIRIDLRVNFKYDVMTSYTTLVAQSFSLHMEAQEVQSHTTDSISCVVDNLPGGYGKFNLVHGSDSLCDATKRLCFTLEGTLLANIYELQQHHSWPE